MDKLCDLYNWVNACEMANIGEREISMRRASGFNELFEVTMQKEIDLGSANRPNPFTSGWSGEMGSQKQLHSWKVKGKKKASEVAEEVRRHAENLWKDALGRPDTKWTWGVNLTSQDLQNMVRGADKQYQLPHSGYDDELNTGKLRDDESPNPEPDRYRIQWHLRGIGS